MTFVPFDADEKEIAELLVLRDGVPDTMRPALIDWIADDMATGSHGFVNMREIQDIENTLDLGLGLNVEITGSVRDSATRKLLNNLNGRQLLRVADYRLSKKGDYGSPGSGLERILSTGRSKFTVVKREKQWRLGFRVEEGVREAAEQVMSGESAASRLLRRAWNEVHDLEPADGVAYWNAVKAVEAAAFPALGVPADHLATLSTAVREIEKKDAGWRLPFVREHTDYPSKEVLLSMLKSMYRGQRDRHGSEAYSDVTHDEAEAAVLMAVTLVGWFAGGLVQQRDSGRFG